MSATVGRRILVTGAVGGIGGAVARHLASGGARVLGLDRPEVVSSVPPAQDSVMIDALDLSAPDASARVRALCRRRLGGLDGLVNNAGIEHRARLEEHGDEDWRRVLGINLEAPFQLARDLTSLLVRGDGPAIVNVCSIAVTGFAGQVAYDASKGGLLTLTRSLAAELGPRGIRVNAVCPGFIDTPMLDHGSLRRIATRVVRTSPLGRLGTPDEVATVIGWLLGEGAAYVTGESIFVDGGMSRR